MNMKCRDLSTLRSFKKIRLIAGSGGLDHIITWVYINQDSSISDWIHGGELVFITGMENGFSEEMLCSLVRECIENAAAGIVVLIESYSSSSRGDNKGCRNRKYASLRNAVGDKAC